MGHVASAGFPVVTLRQAIDRIGALYSNGRASPLTIDDAASHLGFGKSTPPARRVIRALVDYGLLEKTSADRLRVTKLAIDILQSTSEFELDLALVEAADRPKLFRALTAHIDHRQTDEIEWQQWFRDHGVAKASLDEAARIYRKTVDFVAEPRRRLNEVLAVVAARGERQTAKRHSRAKGAERLPLDQNELELTDIAWE